MVYFDLETHLISPGCTAPRLVVAAYQNGESAGLLDRKQAIEYLGDELAKPDQVFTNHHIQYDLGVLAAEDPKLLPLIFRAYDEGRVRCTKIRQQLLDIATGDSKFWSKQEEDDEGKWSVYRTEYSLEALARRVLGRKIAKAGTWRLRYALLDGVPISDWPDEAKSYAATDVEVTAALYDAQASQAVDVFGSEEIADSANQHRAAWALHLMSMWGLRTDREAVIALHRKLDADIALAHEKLKATPIFRVSGQKNMKEIKARVEAGYAGQGLETPRTLKGAIQYGADVLKASKDPDLSVLADSLKSEKVLSVWMKHLYDGINRPINVNYNVLVDTGRTSAAQPPIQQPPRKGDVRPSFIARPGFVYCFVDYDTAELRSLSQVCLDFLGYSAMAEALRRGDDLHVRVAAEVLGISYEDAFARHEVGDASVIEWRQQAKPANFGLPGGMSAATYVEYVASQDLHITLETAQKVRDSWFAAWPEMKDYFAIVGDLTQGGFGDVVQVRSGRCRGRVRFTAAANGFFQGLTADGAKDALYRVTREAYLDASSPLYGTRPVIHLHDEIVAEVPYDRSHPERASNAADRMAAVMIEAMQKWHPDVPITAKPVLCRRWYKGAKPIRVDGLLVPVKPEKSSDGQINWVSDA